MRISRDKHRYEAKCLLASALLVTGCLVGPDYKRPEVPLNAQWNPKGDGRIASQSAIDIAWWKSLNDPALDRLVEIARRQNLPLQIAGPKILEARARIGIAVGYYYPVNQNPIASGGGGGLHNDNLNLYYGQYQVGFDAAWELDFWGKSRGEIRRA